MPKELVLDHLGAKQWVCVDLIGHVSGGYQKRRFSEILKTSVIVTFDQAELMEKEEHIIFNGDATLLPNCFYDRFDIVVSFATLEHVLEIPSFLEKIQESVKDSGLFFTQFGPVWSSHIGHHCWVSRDINFHHEEPIGKWGHLLLTPPEMYERLISSGFSQADSRKAIFQIYFSPRINRVFADDYKHFFRFTEFHHVEFFVAWKEVPSSKKLSQLIRRFGGRNDFSTGSYRIVCRK